MTRRVLVGSGVQERRRGFDRRGSGSRLMRALVTMRDSPAVLLLLLAAINAMNALDFALTLKALRAGNAEANPVMAAMFAYGPAPAAAFKLLCVAGVSWVVWQLREYRRVLLVGLAAFGLYTGVMVVHFYGSYLYL